MENSAPLIYVLHPNAEIRASMKATLEGFGIQAQVFAEVKPLLVATHENLPSAFIVDVDPVRSPKGLALIRGIREKLAISNPILVTCDKGETELMREVMEAQASDCLVMPIQKNYFASRLHRFISTPQIVAARENYADLPGLGGPAKVTVVGRIGEIDELGIRLVGGILPVKGTTYKLDCEFLDEIFGCKIFPTATVISTTVVRENESYSAYFEFEENPELLQAIRRWLASQPEEEAVA